MVANGSPRDITFYILRFQYFMTLFFHIALISHSNENTMQVKYKYLYLYSILTDE